MKKLAYGDGEVYCSLSTAEFAGLAGDTHHNISDGTNVSLAAIKQKVDLVDAKTAELADLKTACEGMITKLTTIGV